MKREGDASCSPRVGASTMPAAMAA
jgi:hypothetical protein